MRDDAPHEAARTFERCCDQGAGPLGTCVPAELLSREQAAALPVGSCSDEGTRCAPSDAVTDSGGLESCNASWFNLGPPIAGLCIPECFVGGLGQLFLGQERCTAGKRCAPCALLGAFSPSCP